MAHAHKSLEAINIKSITDGMTDDWSNVVLAHNNDHVIRVSVMERDFHWHKHDDSDDP